MTVQQEQAVALFTARLENAICDEDSLGIEATFKAVVCMVEETQSALERAEKRCEELRCQLGNTNRSDRDYQKALENEYVNHKDTTKALEQERKQHGMDNKGDQDWINSLCEQLCKMEDALGFKNDCYDKKGQWVPTIGPWLERVRDLLAAEGEVGDLKEALDQAQRERDEAREEAKRAWGLNCSLNSQIAVVVPQRDELQAKCAAMRDLLKEVWELHERQDFETSITKKVEDVLSL